VTRPKPKRRRGRGSGNTTEHSSKTNNWGSPRTSIDIGRAVLGHITVDPFTNELWNQVIGAQRIFTAAQNGYRTPWFDGAPAPGVDDDVFVEGENDNTAWVNGPGDRTGRNIQLAWVAIETYHRLGWLGGGGIWVGFNLNQFQTCQRIPLEVEQEGKRNKKSTVRFFEHVRPPTHRSFLRCVPSSRWPYQKAPGVDGDQPPRPSWFALLPATNPRIDGDRQRDAFRALCERIGEVF